MIAFYRLCRAWHGYLSAAAFVWLMFFSVTGILLNHPAWMRGDGPATVYRQFRLDAGKLKSITAQKEIGPALVRTMRGSLGLKGEIDSSDLAGSRLFVRMRGAVGSTDLQLDVRSGEGSTAIEIFPAATLFKELHRGKQVGRAWRALIDVAGVTLVATSILGLLIYFSMRLRLRTALALVAGGAALMAAGIVLVMN
jgi:hypothetical protein